MTLSRENLRRRLNPPFFHATMFTSQVWCLLSLVAGLCYAGDSVGHPEWKTSVISWIFPHMVPIEGDYSVQLVPGSVVATPTEWFWFVLRCLRIDNKRGLYLHFAVYDGEELIDFALAMSRTSVPKFIQAKGILFLDTRGTIKIENA